jgi:hypothetical protein
MATGTIHPAVDDGVKAGISSFAGVAGEPCKPSIHRPEFHSHRDVERRWLVGPDPCCIRHVGDRRSNLSGSDGRFPRQDDRTWAAALRHSVGHMDYIARFTAEATGVRKH